MTFSAELRERALELVGRYPVGRSALLPLLHLVQVEDGYISPEGIAACAELLRLTKAEVGAVATFYSMYKREPLGEHLVSVCTNFSCKVRGGQEVYDRLSDKLGVGHNGTTPDGTFTLEHAECLGNCEGAPVVSVDYLNYECVSADAAEKLVDRIAAGDVPPPTRGMVPPGVRTVSYRLAGLGPRDPSMPGAPSSHARADDGAVPQPDAGPGVTPVTVEPSLSDADIAERAEARRQVREAGYGDEAIEGEAGPRSREFPTRPQEGDPIIDDPTHPGPSGKDR
ncbi:MAG TPA: NAD(P)H-dependent oxidoreductase subunit E [Egibacteraceae bacterium]|nr:NAD(P)H-dependent oxidoreductase subunit E [Egibacteraceae bacterium]